MDYAILDQNGEVSDVFSLSLADLGLGNSIFSLNASFCSDDAVTCPSVTNPMTTHEDALGNFTLDLASLDANLSSQGVSVPEPATVALLGIGLAGMG